MWTAQLNRLPTRSRLVSWGLPVPSSCCLCSVFVETRDHLFLRCVYSEQVWNLLQSRLRLSPFIFYTWPSLQAWLNLKTDPAPPLLRMLAAQVTIYLIWKQRNSILHNQVVVPPTVLFKELDRVIRNTISVRRNRRRFRNLMVLWIR